MGWSNMENRSLCIRLSSYCAALCVITAAALNGCAGLPSSGPSGKDIRSLAEVETAPKIQIIDLNSAVAYRIIQARKVSLFSEVFTTSKYSGYLVGAGDVLEINIWEAPPTTLFSIPGVDERGSGTARGTTIPEQMVGDEGLINVPFAGKIRAAGLTLHQIESRIAKRLEGLAHKPQVLVRLVRNSTANVTVVGEVANSTRMPLTPRRERLLDALAASGGVKHPVSHIMLQLTREDQSAALPLETVIGDPKQNVFLQPGDVVTALFQPHSFTILGAAGKNDEVSFNAKGISLIQALGRAGGLHDSRADAQGVFIFRFESADSLDWPIQPVYTTPQGRVPVIYRANLKDPSVFFAAQEFPIKNNDLIYVSNASIAELQKFLNIIMTIAYPPLSIINTMTR